MALPSRTRSRSVPQSLARCWFLWLVAPGGDQKCRQKAKYRPIGYNRSAMNQTVRLPKAKRIGYSACPHDCPSTCALEVELLDERTIGRVHGAKDNDYTAGVICAKVARYAEREHHAKRLLHPLRRKGEKRSGEFEKISWDHALDLVAEKFVQAEQRYGAESVWPYYYAGTMGLVMRDGINRLRHVKKYSGFHSTICVNPAYAGFAAGVGRIAGVDPREMAKSDLVVIWGTNAVNTQVNVMKHAVRARKERGAKIAVVDIYMNGTMQQADLPVLVRPGTDGALACAVMHCLFRDGKADWEYLDKYTDAPRELEAHLRTRDPAWASAITGTPGETIEQFAQLIGERKRVFFRLGYIAEPEKYALAFADQLRELLDGLDRRSGDRRGPGRIAGTKMGLQFARRIRVLVQIFPIGLSVAEKTMHHGAGERAIRPRSHQHRQIGLRHRAVHVDVDNCDLGAAFF